MTDRFIREKLRRLRAGAQPRVLDLFSGCGGLSLGFSATGFKVVAAVENDAAAVASFGTNFHTDDPLHTVGRDITSTTPGQLVRELKLSRMAEAFDVIIGGPPCQAFARVGRSKLREIEEHPEAFRQDPRAMLYTSYLRYVKSCRPVAILMENVPDAMNFGGHNVPEDVCEALGELGYVCGYTLLNAALYGVPQMRERMFLLAYHREIAETVSFPEPTHWIDLPPGYKGSRQVALKLLSKNSLPKEAHRYVDPPVATDALPPAVTAEDAIGDLPKIDAQALMRQGKLKRGARRFDKLMPYDDHRTVSVYARSMKSWAGFEAGDGIHDHVIRYLPRDYPLFARMKEGDQYPEAQKRALRMFDDELSKLARKSVRLKPGSNDYEQLKSSIVPPYDASKFPNKWRKISRGQPVRTIMAHLSKDGYSHIHYDNTQARTISVREAARLQSFPDGFVFSGAMNQAFRQIGNAVPPLMAKAIASEIMKTIRGSANVYPPQPPLQTAAVAAAAVKAGFRRPSCTVWAHWRKSLKPEVADTSTTEDETSDILTPEQRRLLTSRIKGNETEPEMLIRCGLHGRGLRYRLHVNGIPGKPDMVFPKYRAAIFVHGCFEHRHGCSLSQWPETRAGFWNTKINGNALRDREAMAALEADGWRVLVIWECALNGRHKRRLPDVLDCAEAIIRQGRGHFTEIVESRESG